jgi:hypothetical protein
MDDPILATKLRALGENFFDDPLIRQGFAATGQAGNFQALAPRRPNELPRLAATTQSSGNSTAFDGVYRGQMVQFSDPAEAMLVEVSLRRDHDNVNGHYTFGLGVGTISGTVVGNRLYFEWEWGNNFRERNSGSPEQELLCGNLGLSRVENQCRYLERVAPIRAKPTGHGGQFRARS